MQTKRYGLWKSAVGQKYLLYESDDLEEVRFNLDCRLFKLFDHVWREYKNGSLKNRPTGSTYETAIVPMRDEEGFEIYDNEKETVVQ